MRTSDRWSLWGTYAFLAVDGPRQHRTARATADALLDEVELACSRFREDSGLSRANRHPGRWVQASPMLVQAVRVAVAAAEATDGIVDPCLGRALVSLGYDRDLAELRPAPAWRFGHPTPTVRPGAWREIGIEDDAIRVPHGVALDLGATAKAWAADLVAETLAELGCAAVISLGGDLRVAGPHDASWPVRVTEGPEDASGVDVLVTGGLATSTTVVRRWGGRRGSPERHHLLDPRTGLPATEAYRTVTAAGDTCLAANTASAAAVVLGHAAPAWLRDHGVTARLVATDGEVLTVGAWPVPDAPAGSLEAVQDTVPLSTVAPSSPQESV